MRETRYFLIRFTSDSPNETCHHYWANNLWKYDIGTGAETTFTKLLDEHKIKMSMDDLIISMHKASLI